MCMDLTVNCACSKESASFNFRDQVMPAEVIKELRCPECSGGVAFDPATMVRDNGWVIEFDMEVAKFMGSKLPAREITPEFIFDEGYCTWRGIYPMDHIDSIREREELIKLSKINPRKYLEEFKQWSIKRMERLASEGWRKANAVH